MNTTEEAAFNNYFMVIRVPTRSVRGPDPISVCLRLSAEVHANVKSLGVGGYDGDGAGLGYFEVFLSAPDEGTLATLRKGAVDVLAWPARTVLEGWSLDSGECLFRSQIGSSGRRRLFRRA